MFNIFPLSRFHKAQEEGYPRALAEIKAGLKTTHWIWYIFPQLKGLGKSAESNFYGLSGVEEATAYLQDEYLAVRLCRCLVELMKHVYPKEKCLDKSILGKDLVSILGEIDTIKLRSCLTLFSYVKEEDITGAIKSTIELALRVLFQEITCPATHALLEYPPTRSLTDREKNFLTPYLKGYSSKYPPFIFYRDLSPSDKKIVRGLEKIGVLYPYMEEKPRVKLCAFNIFLLEVGYGLKLDSSGYSF